MLDIYLRYLSNLSSTLNEDGDEQPFLDRLVLLAAQVASADGASVTAHHHGRLVTVATAGCPASAVDDLQQEVGEGPSNSVLTTGRPQRSGELGADERWPTFGRSAALRLGVVSSLSLPLQREPLAALVLNLYAGVPDAFSLSRSQQVETVAGHAQMAISAHRERIRAAQLERALDVNRRVGAAVGMVMVAHKVSMAQASQLLRRASESSGRRLVDVADEVLATGALLPSRDETQARPRAARAPAPL